MAARHWLLGSALLVSVCGGSACQARYGPSEIDRNWHTFDSLHFTLYVRPSSFAENNQVRLGEVLDDQYEYTQTMLGVQYAGRISAYLYRDGDDAGLESNSAGVAYPRTEAMRATCPGPLDGNLYSLIQHEANHVIQQSTLGRPGTSMVNEGLPSAVVSTRYHNFGKDFLYSWTASHLSAIPPLADLSNDDKWNGSEVQYKASASFLAYLIDLAGAAPIRMLYQVRSKDFAAKVQSLYGRSLEELEHDWRAFCVAHG
jgi:hypothetical protein